MEGGTFEVFATGLSRPSGLEIHEGELFVSDHATGEIVAYALDTGAELGRAQTGATGIMGLTVGPDGRMYFADGVAQQVVRIDP